jgi:hypothetical protein
MLLICHEIICSISNNSWRIRYKKFNFIAFNLIYICLTFVINLGKQMAITLNQEPFDLGTWIANKLGLNIEREDHKRRLEELKEAFDKAGYRKLDAVQVLYDDDLSRIDSKLENKLESGEKKLLKKNL